MEAGLAVKEGILSVCEADVIVKPLADGGEGTVEALLSGMGGKEIGIEVTGPLGMKIPCIYGILEDSKTAIIEVASAAGLKHVPSHLLNPLHTTTYGVGEIIKDAIQRGCRDFIIGLGGSSTNDGGIGMLEALGYIFYDEDRIPIGPQGEELLKICDIDGSRVIPELKECHFRVACDVNNPLYGPLGASHVFGPQKGATPDNIELLDAGLKNFSDVVKKVLGKDNANISGTGAAGGLGYAFTTFLNSKLESGIQIILDELHLEEDIKDADFVITGEGKLDFQTAMGKAPIGVATLAKKHGIKVIAFAGGATDDAVQCNQKGVDAYFSILQLPMALDQAMLYEIARKNVVLTVSQVFRLIYTVRKDLL